MQQKQKILLLSYVKKRRDEKREREEKGKIKLNRNNEKWET